VTYRAKAQSRSARRRAWKEARIESSIKHRTREWLLKHPPRVEMPIEIGGKWHGAPHDFDRFYEVRFSQTPRPESPIVRVPIFETGPSVLVQNNVSSHTGDLRTIDMRPIAMGLSYGATRLRWYNWEPVQGMFDLQAEADIYSNAGKIQAFMSRLSPVIDMIARSAPQYLYSYGFDGPELVEWWRETIDAFDTWRGRVHSRYVIPSKDDPSKVEEVRT